MLFFLNPPDSEAIKKIKREVSDAESYYSSTRLNLGQRKLKQLERICRTLYTAWDEAYGPVRTELKELNRLLEGKQEPTDFPFGAEASSQIDMRLPAEKFRSLRANFRRAVFGTPDLITAVLKPGSQMQAALRNKVESAINWTVNETTNLSETLKDTDLPIFRDGTALVFGEYVREVEHGIDCKVYKDIIEFQADYPDAETAGVTEEKYSEILSILNDPAETEVRVEYEIDFLAKNGPQYTLFPYINFIHGPFHADKMRDLIVYGYPFKEGRLKFMEKKKRGYYYSEAAKDMDVRLDSTTYEDEWDQEQDDVEGVQPEYKDAFRFARLIVKADLDQDRRAEVYNVIFWPEKNRILRVENYRIRRNIPCVVPFKFIGRDNRLAGVSLLKDGKDMFGEINAMHRHRSNRRKLTDEITLIAPDSMKETLGDNYEFHTGGVIYAPNDLFAKGEVPRQFAIATTGDDTSRDEALTVRYLEALMGPSMGMSGQEDPGDPNAPGNKTAMLLQQANYRVADYIDEWKRAIPDMSALHTALLYQNSSSKIAFRDIHGDEDEVDSSLLVSEFVKWALKAKGVSISPEADMARIANIAKSAMIFGGVPFKINPKLIVDMWNDYVTSSRIPGFERYLIKLPEQTVPAAPPAPPSGTNLPPSAAPLAVPPGSAPGAPMTNAPGA